VTRKARYKKPTSWCVERSYATLRGVKLPPKRGTKKLDANGRAHRWYVDQERFQKANKTINGERNLLLGRGKERGCTEKKKNPPTGPWENWARDGGKSAGKKLLFVIETEGGQTTATTEKSAKNRRG